MDIGGDSIGLVVRALLGRSFFWLDGVSRMESGKFILKKVKAGA